MTEQQPEAVQPPPQYQQPPQPQQPPYQQAQQPPHYQQAPHYQQGEKAPYQQVSDDQRRIWETKGKRGMGFGAAWFIGGLLITLITYGNASGPSGGVYVVAWGPMLYGAYRIISGYFTFRKSQQ